MLKDKTKHQRSKAQEDRVASQTGGKKTPGSGNKFYAKGDVKTKHILVECKTTKNDSYSLKKDDFERLMDQALSKALDPVFQVDMPNLSLAIVPWANFMTMLGDFELVMNQQKRIEDLEKSLKILIHELFKQEKIEHTDEAFELLHKKLNSGDIPEIDLKL